MNNWVRWLLVAVVLATVVMVATPEKAQAWWRGYYAAPGYAYSYPYSTYYAPYSTYYSYPYATNYAYPYSTYYGGAAVYSAPSVLVPQTYYYPYYYRPRAYRGYYWGW
jgi:hypothetical protein